MGRLDEVDLAAALTERERRCHFLSRFAPWLPGWGGMTVFDRTGTGGCQEPVTTEADL